MYRYNYVESLAIAKQGLSFCLPLSTLNMERLQYALRLRLESRRPSTPDWPLDWDKIFWEAGPASVRSISARARSRYARLALRIPRRERRALALCREQP